MVLNPPPPSIAHGADMGCALLNSMNCTVQKVHRHTPYIKTDSSKAGFPKLTAHSSEFIKLCNMEYL